LNVSCEFNTDSEAQAAIDPSMTMTPGLTEMGVS